MFDAGCRYIGFGGESASPSVLKFMGKGGQMLAYGTRKYHGFDLPETMVTGFGQTVQAGVHANLTWMLGFPGSSIEDEKHSVAFMEWQKEVYPGPVNERMFCATAYPGTPMFRMQAVKERLASAFGIAFDGAGQPIADDAFLQYVLSLDDADKVLAGKDGRPVNFGLMSDDLFLQVRAHIDAGETQKILSLTETQPCRI